jgi:hypothetical protein
MDRAVAAVWSSAASYIPSEIIRNLVNLTRMRASSSQEASRIGSRIQKVLEDALASVATNVLGKSVRAMLEDIIRGRWSGAPCLPRPRSSPGKDSASETCFGRKDPFPSSLFASAFAGSNPVSGT